MRKRMDLIWSRQNNFNFVIIFYKDAIAHAFREMIEIRVSYSVGTSKDGVIRYRYGVPSKRVGSQYSVIADRAVVAQTTKFR